MKFKFVRSILVLCLALSVPAMALAQDGAMSQTKPAKPATVTNQQIPVENIDGSKVDKKTQNETVRLVNAYQEAQKSGNKAGMDGALADMAALHTKDGKNLSLITWLGYIYTSRGDYQEATPVLEPASGKSSSPAINTLNHKNLAACLYNSGKYAQAAPILTALTQELPNEAENYALLGSSYVLTQKYAEAVAPLEKAKSMQPSQSVNLDLAIAYSRSGKVDKALDLFDSMRKDGGLNEVQLAWMGYLYLDNGRTDDAITTLEAARKMDANDPAVVNNLANAYLKRNGDGDHEKAAKMFEELVRLVPKNTTAAYNAGVMYLEDGEYAKSVPFLQRAAAANDPFALNNLGRAYEGLGNVPDAAKNYAAASDLRTDNAMFAKNAGVMYNKQGNDSLTIKYLERARAAGENAPEVLVNLANAYSRTGNTAKSDEIMNSPGVADAMANNADYWFNRGVVAQKSGQKDDAEAAYKKALEIKPDDIDATNNLGVLLFDNGDYQGALTQFEKLAGLDENSALAKRNLAACYAKLGQMDDAINTWKELVRKYPNDTSTRLDLADALWNEGDAPGARFHYMTVLKTDPKNSRAMNGMGLWSLLQNNTSDAAVQFKKAVDADRTNLSAYRNLAIAYERLNRVPDAIKVLEAALKVDPGYKDGQEMLTRLKSSR